MTTNTETALANGATYRDIELGKIRISPDNRKRFNEGALQELAASIKSMGVAQPILIRPVTPTTEQPEEYEIVAGERRYRASNIASMGTIPVIIRQLSDLDAAKIRILENLQRENPHEIEEAEGFQLLMEQHSYTADQLAEEIGKSRAYVYARLKLCALSEKVRTQCFDGHINASIALLIARIPSAKLQEKCAHALLNNYGPVSVRMATSIIERDYMVNLKKAKFKTSDSELVPSAGACSTCPKRTGNQPEVFKDVSADVCTDPTCFKAKGEAHVVRIVARAKDAGVPVISGAAAKKIMPHNYSDLNGGYVLVDKPVYSDGQNRSYRQMLGKDLPQTTLLESPHDDEVHHIIKVEDLTPLLKEKGLSTPNRSGSHREREKEQEARVKLEREYRTRLFMANHHSSLMMNLVDPDLRLVAAQMFENLSWGMIPTKTLIRLYGWTEEQFNHPRRENIRAAIDALTQPQLNQFIRDCALCRELDVNIYTEQKSKPENMLAFAKRTKVDAKRIRAEVEAEAKAKAEKKNGPKKSKEVPTPAPAAAPAALKSNTLPGIDISKMGRAEFTAFLTTNPGQISDLARAIVDRGTDDQVHAFNDARDELGYVVSNGDFIQVQEPQQDVHSTEKQEVAA